MKSTYAVLAILLFLTFSISIADDSKDECIHGTVTLANNIADQISNDGKLFIYVREIDRKKGPPTALVTIPNPNYPQIFELCSDDQMIPAASPKPLIGRYRLYARHSKTGAPMVKEGFLGVSVGENNQGIQVGDAIKVVIQKPLAK